MNELKNEPKKVQKIVAQQELRAKNFEIARLSRGISQTELAIKLGVEQGTISKIENGSIVVKRDLLIKYCEELDYPETFFCEPINILSPYLIYFRKRKTMGNLELDVVQHKLYLTKHWVKKLLKSLDIKRNVPYIDTNKGSPKDIARYIRTIWKIPKGRIEKLIPFFEKAGIVILLVESNDKYDGEIIPDEDGLPVICINKHLSGDRQRYTLAHELGHLIMHTEEFQEDLRRAETEADEFAAELLMPGNDITPHLYDRLSIERLSDLKAYWKVSFAALIKRAFDLQIINKAKYTSLFVRLSQAGYRKQEPTCGVYPETPTLINRMISLHLNELEYSPEELAEYLCITNNELKKLLRLYEIQNSITIVR